MHPFALLIAFTAQLLSTLTGGSEAGEAAERRRITDSLTCEPRVWQKVAAWLGWIPMRARRAPVYVRRMPPDLLHHSELWSRSGH